MLAGSDQVRREVVAAGTPIRLRLINTDQQPRRFALSGTPFRVVALDGVDLNGPTEVSGQALRDPRRRPLRPRLHHARRAGPAVGRGGPAGGACCWPGPATSPTREGRCPRPLSTPRRTGRRGRCPRWPAGTTSRATLVLDRLPRLVNGRPALAQTVNGGVYPDIPPIMVAEGDLVRMRVVNRSFETHPMHPHGHHVLVLSVNGRVLPAARSGSTPSTCSPARSGRSRCAPTTPASGWTTATTSSTRTQGMMFHLAYAGDTPFTHGPGTPNAPE